MRWSSVDIIASYPNYVQKYVNSLRKEDKGAKWRWAFASLCSVFVPCAGVLLVLTMWTPNEHIENVAVGFGWMGNLFTWTMLILFLALHMMLATAAWIAASDLRKKNGDEEKNKDVIRSRDTYLLNKAFTKNPGVLRYLYEMLWRLCQIACVVVFFMHDNFVLATTLFLAYLMWFLFYHVYLRPIIGIRLDALKEELKPEAEQQEVSVSLN